MPYTIQAETAEQAQAIANRLGVTLTNENGATVSPRKPCIDTYNDLTGAARLVGLS